MYTQILVPVDGSSTSDRGLDEAVKLAKLTGARIRLVHVIDQLFYAGGMEGFGAMTVDLIPLLREGGEKILQACKIRVEAAGVPVDTVLFDSSSERVCDRVVTEATTWHADLIVIGTHGRRGAGRVVMGSDAEQIVRHATTPVLLVRSDETTGLAPALTQTQAR
ncbi:MAG: universal stress protein [Cytophagales bacterium]|nr:universal stress protein [Rhizobacter sp.]